MFDRMMELAAEPGASASITQPSLLIMCELYELKKASSVAPNATAFPMTAERPSLPLMINWEGDSPEATKDANERVL